TINKMSKHLDRIEPLLEFDKEKLWKELRPHLKQNIRKQSLKIEIEPNPLFYQIKQKYQDHYLFAQNIYKIFCDEFNMVYSDDEASLIAIYLYKNTNNKDIKKIKAYLVCGSGRGFSKLIEQRLSNIFPNITVLETLSSFYLLR